MHKQDNTQLILLIHLAHTRNVPVLILDIVMVEVEMVGVALPEVEVVVVLP